MSCICVLYKLLISCGCRRQLAYTIKKKLIRSDTQKASLQEKRNTLMRQIRKWRQAQLTYMPGAVASLPTHDPDLDENGESDTGDPGTPENVPLILPSEVESTSRNAVCQHRVAEYEQQLRFAQLQDSLIELRRVRRIKHSLLMNHRTQVAGQGQRANTRSRAFINNIEERIEKFAQRYRAAYGALLQLDGTGTWQETYLELTVDDNRGLGKEEHEQGLGDGSYTFSWIWLLNPRACDAGYEPGFGEDEVSDEELNEVMRVQWTTSHARMERWSEEVKLLQEEMRRVLTFLEWKSGNWLAKRNMRLATASPSIQSGLEAYARKQAAIHHDLAVSFARLWYPVLVSHGLEHSWITKFVEQCETPSSDTDTSILPARETSESSVPGKAVSDPPRSSANSHARSQGALGATMDGNDMLLEEATYVEGDEDDGDDDSVASDGDSVHSGSSGDDDSDFDFVWD